MNPTDQDKVGLKFWIASLAFSILLLATTFALLANYLAEIKANTMAALTRADILAEQLNTIDKQMATIHRHIMLEKAASLGTQPISISVEPPTQPQPAPETAPTAKETPPPSIPTTTPPAISPPPATTKAN